VVNSPIYRDRIIQALSGRFTSKAIDVNNGEGIISILKSKNFDSAEVLIWVLPEEPTEDILNTLNNFRELFYEGRIPNVVFYNQAFSENVIKKAPDFWRYRGNYYEFKEMERGLAFEALEVLTNPLSYEDKEELLRRKRINEYLIEKVRDKQEKSNILSELGLIHYYLGEFNEALEYHQNALKLNEDLKNKIGIANSLEKIGLVYRIKGEYDKALEYHQSALKLNEELKIKRGIASSLEKIGLVYKNKGELDKALEYHQSALKLNEELKFKIGIANSLGNIGVIYAIKGKSDKALEFFEKALKSFEELGIKEGIGVQLESIGIIYEFKGQLAKALEYLKNALGFFQKIGNRIETARTLMNMGDIFIKRKDKKRAMECYQEAQSLATGSYFLESINERLQTLDEEVIAEHIQKSTK